MKNVLLTLLLLLGGFVASAQDTNIQDEILNATNSKSNLIAKGRTLLLDRFIEGDYQKVGEIKDYLLKQVQSPEYMALYPGEHWLILYWTRQYTELLDQLRGYDAYRKTPDTRIRPAEDQLFTQLKQKSLDCQVLLESFLPSSGLPEEDIALLRMNLRNLLLVKETQEVNQDTLNSLSENFFKQYPNSAYEPFIREYIRYKLVPSPWAFDVEYFTGYGIFTGTLSELFTNSVPLGVAFDVYYKKLAFGLRDHIGLNFLRTTLSDGVNNWNSGSQVRIYLPELTLGWTAVDNKRLMLTPFVGLASMCISPTDYDIELDPNLKDAGLPFTQTFTVGLSADLKFSIAKMRMYRTGKENSYAYIRLRYAYTMPGYEHRFGDFDGVMHNFTLGVGFLGRKLKRDR